MRVSTKINLAILSTLAYAVVLLTGTLYVISTQFKNLERAEQALTITRLSTSLLVLTQEYVLFKSPSVADSWRITVRQLEQLLDSNLSEQDSPQEFVDIRNSLVELTPIFNELSNSALSDEIDREFLQQRQSLIVERLIAETQVISELGYQWASLLNMAQANNLKGLTVLGMVGLGGFVVVIALLVVLMRTGVLNPLIKLQRAADEIRNGNEDALCDVNTRDELGDVARAVNQMAHNLAQKNKHLREASLRIEMSSQAKTDFLSNMSHEIRTPLNGIVGLTYLLKGTLVSNNQKLLLESLEKTSRNLIDLVGDVLDLSKIEAGSMELDRKQFSTLEFVDKVSGLMTGAAAGKPIELIIDVSPDLPKELIGDELRLRQIIVNLVGNSIKFTQGGHVYLSIHVVSLINGFCCLRVEVQDTGVGISPQGQANLFRQFHQENVSTAREFGGSGLGLSLVKKLVGLMKGTLGFNSEAGHGSVFWTELKFEIPATPLVAATEQASDGTLLFVSDNELQTKAMINAAALTGRSLKTVPNLLEADKWMQNGGTVNGVLLDFPRTRIVRLEWLEFVNKVSQRNVPCAVLLGSDDTRRLLDEGISEVFSSIFMKPLTPLQLQNAFRSSDTNLLVRTAVPLMGSGKINLLIVDDNELNLKVLEGILSRKHANITKANNGLEALSYLLQFEHGFDAVVMDVQMPLMDGLEATREIRKQAFNADLPVIGLTGKIGPEDEKRALEAGMNAMLFKPLQPDELMFVLNKLIKPAKV